MVLTLLCFCPFCKTQQLAQSVRLAEIIAVQGSNNRQLVIHCRPVDCDNNTVLNYNPGVVNSTIYNDHMEAGWGFHPWISGQPPVQASFLEVQGAGINNTNATCVTLAPQASLGQTFSLTLFSDALSFHAHPQCVW